ncbi:MAG: nucleoside deaminase [Bacteroidales bacterium]|nr:nucleoside deaminase [Bacteroidales bacterium]MDY0215740.1 nucleoside deaminase [Bacteroidales bacterium]
MMNNLTEQDKHYLKMAIDLAIENVKSGGGPFGAVIVKNNEVLATGVNNVTTKNDPTAHAEITAIRNACDKLQDYQLEGCSIYSSCEPCPMCLGAIYWARPEKLFFAASKDDAASVGFDDSFIYTEIPKEIHKRKLVTYHALQKEAYAPFEIWKNMEQKTEY